MFQRFFLYCLRTIFLLNRSTLFLLAYHLAQRFFFAFRMELRWLYCFLALLVPFFAFNVALYHTITATLFDAALRPVIFASAHQSNPFHAGSLFFYVSELLWQNPLFIFACFGLFFRRMRTISLLFFAYLLYFSVIPNKQSRFILDFLPFAVILSSYGLWRVSFFTSFSSLDGTTITTTPLPAAYSNHLFLPIYDNPDVALQLYPAFLLSATYVLYTDDFYPCFDVFCVAKKELLYEQINDNILISNVSVGETSYLLFQVIYT